MPYKDPNRKKEWEQLHRQQRLARRRDLRKLEVVPEPKPLSVAERFQESVDPDFPWPLLVAGAGLAAYSPPLALAAGSLTFVVATVRRQGWLWQLIGALVVLLALFFLWIDHSDAFPGRAHGQDSTAGQESEI